MNRIKKLMPTTCITNCSVCVCSENPADFPNGSLYFVNLVPDNATSHYTNTLPTIVQISIVTFLRNQITSFLIF